MQRRNIRQETDKTAIQINKRQTFCQVFAFDLQRHEYTCMHVECYGGDHAEIYIWLLVYTTTNKLSLNCTDGGKEAARTFLWKTLNKFYSKAIDKSKIELFPPGFKTK